MKRIYDDGGISKVYSGELIIRVADGEGIRSRRGASLIVRDVTLYNDTHRQQRPGHGGLVQYIPGGKGVWSSLGLIILKK